MTSEIDIERHFQGDTLALARAAAEGDRDGVARLVKEAHANPDAISSGGLPLIAWPILQGNAEGTRALLENGANPNLATPGTGAAIVWAAKAEQPGHLAAFLDHGGDPDAFDANHDPLLKVAALAGRWDNVKLLVERGADIDAHSPDQPGDTVLAYYSAGQFDKALWLLEHGADPGYRLERAAHPDRVGAQPIVENTYWWPVDAGRFPQLAQAQQRCQDLLAGKGHPLPPEPAHLARLRRAQGQAPSPAGDDVELEADIAEREARLKRKLAEP